MAKSSAAQTLEFVYKNGCSGDCSTTLQIDNNIDLPCKEWTNMESETLRVRMLTDNVLVRSGLIRMVDRSSLGNSLRIRKHGIDVGPIRTEASGAAKINSCDIHFDTIKMEDFEKHFYIVNTEKNLKICTKKLIGTKWQEWIGDSVSDYHADMFANTDLADLIIADIVDKYTRFLPKRIVMATFKNAGEDLHGDDGILAKAYYASKNQYFHTWEYNFADVEGNFPNLQIQAIVGGCEFEAVPADFGTVEEYLIAFTDWLNELQENRTYLFDASVDLNTYSLIVASNIVTRDIDLRVVLNDGTFVDWGCSASILLAPTELQKSMMVNDTPLLFQYEQITNQNFWQKFKSYLKEFKRYLHRNGFEDIMMSDIRIAIDPELLLEFDDQWHNKLIECCNPTSDISDRIGLPVAKFIPLNCMNDTGLFFMTVDRNILMFSDGSNMDGLIPNFGRVRIKESNCDNKDGEVLVYGGAPPIGMDVEHWGAFATNIAGSFFVKNNELDTTPPYANTAKSLRCYDDNVKNACLVNSACEISCSTTIDAVYDATNNVTTINVSVNASVTGDSALTYDIKYSLSDGTNASGITSPNFTITLPGDQTNSGVVVTVTGTVTASSSGSDLCTGAINESERLGLGSGQVLCSYSDTNDNATNLLTDGLEVTYTAFGNTQTVALLNTGLRYDTPADFPAIELELEAIFVGSDVSISNPSGQLTEVVISNTPAYLSNITIFSTGGGTTSVFAQDC